MKAFVCESCGQKMCHCPVCGRRLVRRYDKEDTMEHEGPQGAGRCRCPFDEITGDQLDFLWANLKEDIKPIKQLPHCGFCVNYSGSCAVGSRVCLLPDVPELITRILESIADVAVCPFFKQKTK